MSIGKILFSFSGRIPRLTYWVGMLGVWAAVFVLAFFIGILVGASGAGHERSGSSAVGVLLLPLYLGVIWSSLALTVKRWHDRGKSGLWIFIQLIPFIGPLWALIELGFLEGTPGPNEYDEGIFARDVSLDADDPLLSAPPIAGRLCSHCQQEIVSFISASLCPECREPLHDSCCREHLAGGHRGPARAAYPA